MKDDSKSETKPLVPKKSVKKIGELLSHQKDATELAANEFKKSLYKCHCIIRNNDKLSPEAAFDEISKILFMKTLIEKKQGDGQILSLSRFKEAEQKYLKNAIPGTSFVAALFEDTKKNYEKDKIFTKEETIYIKQSGFEQILQELEQYNLAQIVSDIKGIAFEELLGKTFRGELGQFFTPRTIVDFMVDILDPQVNERVGDPCCGSGGFLIKTFQLIQKKLIQNTANAIKNLEKDMLDSSGEFSLENLTDLLNSQKRESPFYAAISSFIKSLRDSNGELSLNKPKEIINGLLDLHNNWGPLYAVANGSIMGTDANPRMARTAKMNMIMQGDGHCGVFHRDGLLNIGDIFENHFDVILTNPPFGARIDRELIITDADCLNTKNATYKESKYLTAQKKIKANVGKPILDLFDLGKMTSLTEVIFIERCLHLLKPGGRMGIVLPEGVLNAPNLQKVRRYIESKAKLLLVVSLPKEVFLSSGVNVKPSLVFLKKFTADEKIEYDKIRKTATKDVNKKYAKEIKDIKKKNTGSSPLPRSLKDIHKIIDSEINDRVKTLFNYKIPMAYISKAGISSTGAPDENQLPELAREFHTYRRKHKLWKEKKIEIDHWVINKDRFNETMEYFSFDYTNKSLSEKDLK
ncbi:MAG: N-6 DNA methylase [bacterium]|nr:N-6 DNA methylase [bacterium]